jgi:hypothetical protein
MSIEEQPVTGEPVLVQHRKPVIGWKGQTIGYTAWRDGKGLDGWPHRELYTRPAPSVPADVVRDAERYRWLREQNESLESFTFYVGCDNGPDDDGSVEWVGADLDAAIDAAKDSK